MDINMTDKDIQNLKNSLLQSQNNNPLKFKSNSRERVNNGQGVPTSY